MRQITLVLAIVISLSAATLAQTASLKPTQSTKDSGHSYGYLFAAPGDTSGGGGGTLHIGGGGEGVLNNGLGIGGEVGYIAPFLAWILLVNGPGPRCDRGEVRADG